MCVCVCGVGGVCVCGGGWGCIGVCKGDVWVVCVQAIHLSFL